jgi:type III secretion protein C
MPQLPAWRQLAAAATSALTLALATPSMADAPPWPDAPFTYMAKEHSLTRLVTSFARAYGLEARFSAGIADDAPPNTGRLSAASPTEFLNQLCASYGLMWFYESGVLYLSKRSERVTRVLNTKGFSGNALRKTFTEMGLLDTRFGWADVEEGGGVIVSGPPTYVELLEKAVAALPDSPPEQQLQVFRLKYAAVDDRTIAYRDKQIVTAGVATILRNLLTGAGGQGGTSVELSELAAPLRSSTATAPAAPAAPEAAADAKSGKSTPPGGKSAPNGAGKGAAATIQADSRLNAIIVRDRPQNMPVYKQLISLLDVPSDLIEIEAVIVDVNSSSMGELGIDWSARAGKLSTTFGTPQAAVGSGTFSLSAGSASSIVGDIGNFLLARIRLLEGKGNAHVMSRPSILTQDNLVALIDLSDTFYIQTSGERVASVTPVSVGVTLRVTPRIVNDGDKRSVQLVVDIEDGSIQDVKIGTLPTVRRSTIGTQALVGEHQSLVIGGFNSEQTAQQKDQVPVLGDVPVIGSLFGKKVQSRDKRERLFLITPRIVTPPVQQHAAAQAN